MAEGKKRVMIGKVRDRYTAKLQVKALASTVRRGSAAPERLLELVRSAGDACRAAGVETPQMRHVLEALTGDLEGGRPYDALRVSRELDRHSDAVAFVPRPGVGFQAVPA
jgi:hypothetical protein